MGCHLVSSREAWKDERERKYADGTWMDEIHAWTRAQKDQESREDFGKYSWDKWFERLTLDELQALSDRWFWAIQRSNGHELLVMRWNQQQLNRAILVRQGWKGKV